MIRQRDEVNRNNGANWRRFIVPKNAEQINDYNFDLPMTWIKLCTAHYCPIKPVLSCVEACSQPPDAGQCLAYIPMFYYDRVTDRCLQFVYGGCGGNENKFQTRESCEQRCRIKKEEVTGLGENIRTLWEKHNRSFSRCRHL